MPRRRLVVSFDELLAERVRRAARIEAGGDVSAWLADAARLRLRKLAAERALSAYEADAGEITVGEIGQIRRAWPRR